MRDVVMPKTSMTMTEGELLTWLVSEGEEVAEGDPIAEVMTDKVDMEVEAPADGRVGILIEPGRTVPIGTVIGVILTEGEQKPETPVAATSPPVPEERVETASAVTAQSSRQERGQRAGGMSGTTVETWTEDRMRANGRLRATPAARAMAKRTGVDLGSVKGSGPKGRIRSGDVAEAARETARKETPAPAPGVAGMENATRKTPTGVRGVMARRMAAAAQIPQFTLFADISFASAERVRKALLEREETKVGLTEVILCSVARALKDHPALNAHFDNGEIVEFSQVNLGVAVDTEAGLVVPVVDRAERADLFEMNARLLKLAAAARLGRLRQEEVDGGTFTVTNLGKFGVDAFQPVVNPPQVAILSVGRVTLGAGRVATFGLAADHRAVDGAQAARFIGRLAEIIERPDVELVSRSPGGRADSS